MSLTDVTSQCCWSPDKKRQPKFFLAEHEVEIVASLPCYSLKNVDAQRGSGVFEKSIEALQRLNALGYGSPGSELKIHLVYNPGGAFLPPSQQELESDYKQKLLADFGIPV